MADWSSRKRFAKARLGGLFLALAGVCTSTPAQDAATGRVLYVAHCARCHADPPGAGSVNPLVRTADEILGAIGRVSPMKFLGSLLTYSDLRDLAAYFSAVLGDPADVPDFDVSDVWWNADQSGWGLFLRQHSSRKLISGSWYTYDADGKATWFVFDGGSWTAPGVYTAPLYRTKGTPFDAAHDPAASRTLDAGTVALVFSNRDVADVTFVVDGVRISKKLSRFAYPR